MIRNWDVLKAQWSTLKDPARTHWEQLTDDDWNMIGGQHEKLIAALQERYGLSREEAERNLDEFVMQYGT